jgi:putative transposase
LRGRLSCRAAKLIAPTATISHSFISKTIFENISADPDLDRMDPRLAKSAKAIAANRIRVTFPFERVEQDGLHLPMVVSTPHGTSSDVWLVHAIDCGTGMPLGHHLCIGAPSATEGLLCAESVLYSKKPLFARLGLDIDIDPHGTPHLYVFDNGAEAKNERMHKLVRLGMDVMHCRSHEGNGKPFIERHNRSLKEELEVLGGSTRKDGKDGVRDPVALGETLMTLEDLERWIVRWKYEHWANRVLKRHLRSDFLDTQRLGATPNSRWQSMCGELAFAMPVSPSLSDWRRVRFEHHERALNRKTGVSYEGFNYKGPNLPHLIALFGEQLVEVLVDPDDYRQIFVEVGGDLPPISLTEEFVDESSPAHNLARAKELFRQREGDKDLAGPPAREKFEWDVAVAGAAAQGAASARRKSKAQKNREVKTKAKDSQAVQRAVAQPLAAAATAVGDELRRPANIDFDAVDALPVRSRRSGEVQS